MPKKDELLHVPASSLPGRVVVQHRESCRNCVGGAKARPVMGLAFSFGSAEWPWIDPGLWKV